MPITTCNVLANCVVIYAAWALALAPGRDRWTSSGICMGGNRAAGGGPEASSAVLKATTVMCTLERRLF